MQQTILIIEDDIRLAEGLKKFLGKNGYVIEVANDPDTGMAKFRETRPQLVVLDVMLPGRDGFAVCSEIRRESDVPVIMLTARGDVNDRIAGLEIGADDYIPKPFEPRELLSRIGAVLRRRVTAPATEFLNFGPLKIDVGSKNATFEGSPIELSTSEFAILTLFAVHPGTLYTREQLIDHLRGTDWVMYNRSIDVLISRLRTKLKDDAKVPTYIKTVWGKGYTWVVTADVAPGEERK